MSDLTAEGARLVNRYLNAQRVVEQNREALGRAERDARDAEATLGAWLLPSDARIGETFAVWQADSLFCATRTNDGPKVVVRSRGRRHSDLALPRGEALTDRSGR